MLLQSLLLSTALMLGAMAQKTSVVGLYLATEDQNLKTIALMGSVISAAPDATTYSIAPLPDGKCSWQWCEGSMAFVNGPATFAQHFTEGSIYTEDTECDICGIYHGCKQKVGGPSAEYTGYETMVFVHTTTSWTPVTITAGLEKLLAVNTGAPGTAQTASCTLPSPSETYVAPSAILSARTGNAATGPVRNIVLAEFCGAIVLSWGL